MTSGDEAWVRELLAPLDRVAPVALSEPLPAPRRRRRVVLLVALGSVALAVVAVALAGGVDPFDGIGAADRPQQAGDLDPRVVALVERVNERRGSHTTVLGTTLDPASVRLVGKLHDGLRIYVARTANGELCELFIMARGEGGVGCGPPLEGDMPTTVASFRRGPKTRPITWGVTRDGVTSVSFIAGGVEQTVRVVNNAWVYEGQSAALRSITAHFDDGTSRTLSH
jgi:hypothetical protein